MHPQRPLASTSSCPVQRGLGEFSEPGQIRTIDWRRVAARRPQPTAAQALSIAWRRLCRMLAGRLALLAGCAALACAAGCGGEPSPGQAIRGAVQVEGQPLAHGVATFIPIAPTEGPRVLVPVRAGHFERSAADGPWPGTYRVEITATTPDVLAMQQGQRLDRVPAEAWAGFREIAPEFNRQSTLRVEIARSGDNQFNFDVRWQ